MSAGWRICALRLVKSSLLKPPPILFVEFFAAWHWAWAACSCRRSVVSKSVRVVFAKLWRILLSSFVVVWRCFKVVEVCSQSFASVCHMQSIKIRSWTSLLCGWGSIPSKTGSVHWVLVRLIGQTLKYLSPVRYLQSPVLRASSFLWYCFENDELYHAQMLGSAGIYKTYIQYKFPMLSWLTYCWSRVCMALAPRVYTIWTRCVKTAFQTPSSNSCSRSGASMEWKLKPNFESRFEKAFCETVSTVNFLT